MNPFENRYKIKNQLVTVLWVDITSDSNWKEPIDFDKESLPVCVSTGYLWSKNKNFVKLFFFSFFFNFIFYKIITLGLF